MISALIWGYKMQLGYVGSNWYSVSDQFIRDQQAQGLPICAPGYAYNGSNQCVKVSDAANGGAGNQSAPPITVTVSPSISTQASPQISPAFQQQFQPSNSPASAGTSQVAPTNQNSAQNTAPPPAAAPVQSGYSAADVESLLREQQAQYADMLNQALSQQATQAAPLPTMPAANVDQSSPVPLAPVIPALPNGTTPALTSAPASDNKAGIMLALAGLVAALAFRRKGKNNASSR